MELAQTPTEAAELRARVNGIDWYHTLELAPGVVTPGWLDHRPILSQVPLPASLRDMRCLDVGTFNGFWAFELERRGAAEVVAVDVLDPRRWDWPAGSTEATVSALAGRMAGGQGFEIAREAFGSRVRRHDLSVYDLNEGDIGLFDFVFVGSLLVHLRDPIRAVERVCSVCRPEATLVVMDGIDLSLTLRHPRLPVARLDGRGRPWWWYANASGLARIIDAGGFDLAQRPRRLFIPPGAAWNPPRLQPQLLRSREGREALTLGWLGDPHATIVGRPRPLQ
jgi:tRNA (mo5U34)-methyltransferase